MWEKLSFKDPIITLNNFGRSGERNILSSKDIRYSYGKLFDSNLSRQFHLNSNNQNLISSSDVT